MPTLAALATGSRTLFALLVRAPRRGGWHPKSPRCSVVDRRLLYHCQTPA